MTKITWSDFLERYLKYGEEFLLQYGEIEYHLSFHDECGKTVAEFNVGTKKSGYINFEYPSAIALLENAKINEKSIQEIWPYLLVE